MASRRNRGCTDAIFTFRQLAEHNIAYNRNICMAFIDQEKAFVRVNRNLTWEILGQYGFK